MHKQICAIAKPDRLGVSVSLNGLCHHHGSNEGSMKIIQTNVSYLRNCTLWKFNWYLVRIKYAAGGKQCSSGACLFTALENLVLKLVVQRQPNLLPSS